MRLGQEKLDTDSYNEDLIPVLPKNSNGPESCFGLRREGWGSLTSLKVTGLGLPPEGHDPGHAIMVLRAGSS